MAYLIFFIERDWLLRLKVGLFSFSFSLKSNGKILGALKDFVEFGVDQFLLFNKLIDFGILSELYSFDQAVIKFLADTVGGLHFDVRVSDANQVRNQLSIGKCVHICRRGRECVWKLTFSIVRNLLGSPRRTSTWLSISWFFSWRQFREFWANT